MYKSEKLANQLKLLIENGSLKPHEKLPSLRVQAQISGLSLLTVMNAYQELEAQALIYSKEKSGYYVSNAISEQPDARPMVISLNSKIEINSLIFKYLKSIQGHQIIPFGSAFPNSELMYSKKLIQIMGQITRNKKSYDLSDNLPPGNFQLRKLIAQRYCMQGIAADPDDIVITSGCLDALNLSLQSIAKAGDYILLQQNIFYGAWQAAERLGLKVITIPEHPQYGFDLEAFEHIIKTYPIKVCWLMLNSHNPIGFTVSENIKAKIAELLHQHDIYLIEDDVYEELYFGKTKPLSMKFYDQKNLVLHCSSFSKTLGASFRVGWVFAGKFSQHIQHLQLMSTISVNSILQNALVEFISHHHYEKHLRTLRKHLQQNKLQFFKYLEHKLPPTCTPYFYPSGYFIWMKLPENVDSMTVYQEMIEQNIGVSPSPLFNITAHKPHYLRLNSSFELSETLKQALDTLITCIEKHQNSS
ncbi:PLP-dependent aminotransferase family protein [Acinetobacter bouvetii]|uniref:HTH-type transcriptional regulator NorG n=1 Tax=Acinetobacter bouvetii TaxID=202951 RepID=A0A811GF41_9GAMM|nr:PLP-dependent aminotransferase family protein [Acinetobacter bouvetii]CAB1221717.1 HTH-type transcriptional regulator NorG [Acinetobacter bouvetii]